MFSMRFAHSNDWLQSRISLLAYSWWFVFFPFFFFFGQHKSVGRSLTLRDSAYRWRNTVTSFSHFHQTSCGIICFLFFSEELDMMLQRRAGSGDGGELIDRVSLTSSISFIQSQTFPDSIFSQSFGRYCMNVWMLSCDCLPLYLGLAYHATEIMWVGE